MQAMIRTAAPQARQVSMLDFLVENGALSKALRARMLAWRHGGFSAHNEVWVGAEDAEGRKKLAGYMASAPRCPCRR